MELRIAALEAGMKDVKAVLGRIETALSSVATKADALKSDDRLRKLEAEVAEVKGRVSQLPTALTIFAYMGGLFALEVGLVGGTVALLGYLGRLAGH